MGRSGSRLWRELALIAQPIGVHEATLSCRVSAAFRRPIAAAPAHAPQQPTSLLDHGRTMKPPPATALAVASARIAPGRGSLSGSPARRQVVQT